MRSYREHVAQLERHALSAAKVIALCDDILAGDRPASDAIGHPEIYDYLNAGKSASTGNHLPFLGTSSKIAKSGSVDVLGTVLYMMPAMMSGREACAGRSEGCSAACLAEGTGRMSMTSSQRARRRRHASFYADRGRFLADLHREIERHLLRAQRAGKIPAVRLNGTTDLPWHRMPYVSHDGHKYARLHDAFPHVRFYDYTKHALGSMRRGAGIPPNLHLTFSVSEREDADALASEYLSAGFGAAVVMAIRKHEHPARWALGGIIAPVVDGDAHDARFLDIPGAVVALAAKGRAIGDASGFVRHPARGGIERMSCSQHRHLSVRAAALASAVRTRTGPALAL